MKGLFIVTFGCQMNEYDSIRIQELLSDDYTLVDNPSDADLIILNTCTIREKAEHKVYSLLGRFKHLKRKNNGLIISVAGCVAQQRGRYLIERFPFLDIVFGPHRIFELPDAIRAVESGKGPVCLNTLEKQFIIPAPSKKLWGIDPVRAYVTVMQGCDNFCTYCIVPLVRGREASRPPEDIISEVEKLVDSGIKEITLLGQNVNSYGNKEQGFPSFAELLQEVSHVPGLKRLRFTTSHPKDLSQDLIECFGTIDILCPHIHLPVQSGSNNVLKAMNRKYTRERYVNLVSSLRDICPDISLTTDLIVGFPGETEKDFEETLSLLEIVRYDQIFAFKYSPRQGTRAADFPDQVPEEIKKKRLAQLFERQDKIGIEQLSRFVGKELTVLVDGHSKSYPSELCGRTPGNHVVNFVGHESMIGKEVPVKIERACLHSLRGTLAASFTSASEGVNFKQAASN